MIRLCIFLLLVTSLVDFAAPKSNSNNNDDNNDDNNEERADIHCRGAYGCLVHHLLADYDIIDVPSTQDRKPVVIQLGLSLIRIIEVNEVEQFIKVYMWLKQKWYDPRMTWNTTETPVDEIRIPAQDLWRPDIVMYNSVDVDDSESSYLNSYDPLVIIYPDGLHFWMQPVILVNTCLLDVTYFPYDDQKCFLKFSSWSNSMAKIDLQGIPLDDLNSYIPNGQWGLKSSKIKRNLVKYACCTDRYVDITMTISMRRRSESHNINIVIPSCILSALVLLTFILPPESGERIGLCITVMLAVTVFQQLTAGMMPNHGNPFLGQYYFATTLVTSFSLLVTCFVLHVYYRSTGKVPKLVRKVVLKWLATLLYCRVLELECDDLEMDTISKQEKKRKYPLEDFWTSNPAEEAKTRRKKNKKSVVFDIRSEAGEEVYENTSVSSVVSSNSDERPNEFVKKISDAEEQERRKARKDELEQLRKDEWMSVANVLDRFFFLFFLLATILAFVVVFFRAPRFYTSDDEDLNIL